MKQDIDAALARLAEAFPQTFVLEKYRPHWPLKVGIAADIPARCPAVERRALFAEPHEAELIWTGKTYEVTNVLLPFQSIEQIDEPRAETAPTS